MPTFDTDEPRPAWTYGNVPPQDRCHWRVSTGIAGRGCYLAEGHDDDGWHRCWGDTWLTAWHEDDLDAYEA